MRRAQNDFDRGVEKQRNRIKPKAESRNRRGSSSAFGFPLSALNQGRELMARIRIQDENREISDAQEICEFLKPFGIWYESWDVEGRIGAEATNDEILAAYAPEIDRLKKA